MKPIVAIVGRPNVGKSTLFNRLTRTRDAIVDDQPGVTRDRHYGDAKWDGVEFTVVDTGGFMSDDDDRFMGQIRFQITQAVNEADAVMLVLDGKNGISPFDREIMAFLQNASTPVFYLVNKIDAPEQEPDMYEFYSLGVEALYPVSGAHGYGVRTFLDDLVAALPDQPPAPGEDAIQVAVVGKPNVGKSTLINRILGEERMIVSEVPGTTRDSTDTLCEIDGRTYRLIDTAGLRRKSRVKVQVESFSAVKTLKSLDRCDIALILIDAEQGVTEQDVTIAGYAYERACGCVFLINKWDIAKANGKKAKTYYDDLQYFAKFLGFAPAMTVSAKTGYRVKKMFSLIDSVYDQYAFSLRTGELNNIIERATHYHEPPFHKGRRLKFNYATQISSCPPTFVCFVNYPDAVHFSYKRYLINEIRREAGLDKTPVRLIFREKTGRKDYSAGKRQPARKNRKTRAKR
ncbi:MAG: ribosome biogenesis GTPase Der [Thermodesulfobacteriota bacterium]|nr:ribosome biogenesis GTPase Der [Thermodesulfobacteriota bacterium]